MLGQDDIDNQIALLATHRRTLAHLMEQAAQFGGAVFAPPQTANGIAEARAEIQRIKAALCEGGVVVEDAPNDDALPQAEPVLRVGGDNVAGDKVGGDKVMGGKRTINTEGGDYAEGSIDKRRGTFIAEQHNYYQPPLTLLDRQQQRSRSRMLSKVKSIWITDLLEQSLAKELRIELHLTTEPDAVELPLNALVQELGRPPQPLPAGTSIINVFDKLSGELVILGAPGAGKTTLLLELARDLIAHAEQDEGHPIPVVFSLSSWATKRQPLTDWLVEELNTGYNVPRKLAQAWMDADVVLPLLDGLDEVAADQRGACAEAINTYREEHGLVPLAVCSRVADYEALTTKLRLQGAIIVQPLTKQQVDHYLERAGAALAGVRTALADDAELRAMLDTPLMLSIVTLAYNDKSAAELQNVGTSNERRRHLLDAYISAMFQRRGAGARYTPQQTTYNLSWLANQMVAHSLTVFYIERMQPDWLPQRQRRPYTFTIRLAVGLIYGLGLGLIFELIGGPIWGLAVGLFVGLGFGLSAKVDRIEVTEALRWTWSRDVGIGGLIFGLLIGLVAGLGGGPIFGVGVGLVVGLLFGLSSTELEVKAAPNQGIRRSAGSALVVGLGVGLGVGLLGGLLGGLGVGLGVGLVVGLGVGLDYGGRAIIQHYTLRFLLSRNGVLPFRDRDLVAFLDYCAERIFLRRVGGGWIFVHRLLLEHFAGMYVEDAPR